MNVCDMKQGAKKKHERWVLERFLGALGSGAPAEANSFADHEGPDFVLRSSPGGRLGIEVAGLRHAACGHSSLRLSQVEGIHDRVCEAVRRVWTARGMPCAQINLHFLGHEIPQRRDEDALADEACDALERAMPSDESFATVEDKAVWQYPILARFLHSISVCRSRIFERPCVFGSHSAFLPPLSHEVLQDAIRQKNLKVPSYRRHCETVWLVLSHGTAALSSHFSRHNRPAPVGYELRFDRAFLFDASQSEIVEIFRREEGQG